MDKYEKAAGERIAANGQIRDRNKHLKRIGSPLALTPAQESQLLTQTMEAINRKWGVY